MKSAKFFIKSNYIKNTKNDWILCYGKLLYHQNITFLHLKSENVDRNPSDSVSDTDTSFSGFSALSQLRHSNLNMQRLNVLCNLNQFKSCEIKSVRFGNFSKFAIKLVPSGFLRSKKLYLLPDLEDSLTEWCGLITGFISKSNTSPNFDSTLESRGAISISSTLQSSKLTQLSSQPSNFQDVYISLDDNDAYESSSQDEFHLVTVEMTSDSLKLNMRGNYIMKLGIDSLQLLDVNTREPIHSFPYTSIRRFGAKDNLFKLEAGRHCTTGMGHFIFRVKDAISVAEKLKNNTKQIKLSQSTMHNSCMTLNKPSSSQISLQSEPKIYTTINSPNRQSIEVISQNLMRSPGKGSTTSRTSFRGTFIPKDLNRHTYHHDNEVTRFNTNRTSDRCFSSEMSTGVTRLRSRSGSVSKSQNSHRLSERNLFMNETNIDDVPLPKHDNKITSPNENKIERRPSLATTERPFIFNISPEIAPRYKEQQKLDQRPETILKSSEPISLSNDISITDKFTFDDTLQCSLTDDNNKIRSDICDSIKQKVNTENCDTNVSENIDDEIFVKPSESNKQKDNFIENDKDKCESSEIDEYILPKNPNDSINEDISNSIDAKIPIHDRNSVASEVLNFRFDESINSLEMPDRDLRPMSLLDNSTTAISSTSISVSTNSPSFNSLPFPMKTSTAGYKVSESTFFKYRKQPKPPIRTTPPLNYNTRTVSMPYTSSISPNFDRSESTELPKKSPPPILPKPKFKTNKEVQDQMSFREFDQMLKNLNLSYC